MKLPDWIELLPPFRGRLSPDGRSVTFYVRSKFVLVRRGSGGVLPDGTTNHPPIDFDDEQGRVVQRPNQPGIAEWLREHSGHWLFVGTGISGPYIGCNNCCTSTSRYDWPPLPERPDVNDEGAPCPLPFP